LIFFSILAPCSCSFPSLGLSLLPFTFWDVGFVQDIVSPPELSCFRSLSSILFGSLACHVTVPAKQRRRRYLFVGPSAPKIGFAHFSAFPGFFLFPSSGEEEIADPLLVILVQPSQRPRFLSLAFRRHPPSPFCDEHDIECHRF